MEENCDFGRPKSATYLASNHINLGMQPFYSFNCCIPDAFKSRRISSAENGCGTEAAEQIRSAT